MNHKQAIWRQARTTKNTSGVRLQNKTPKEVEQATETCVMLSEVSWLVSLLWSLEPKIQQNNTLLFNFCNVSMSGRPRWSLPGVTTESCLKIHIFYCVWLKCTLNIKSSSYSLFVIITGQSKVNIQFREFLDFSFLQFKRGLLLADGMWPQTFALDISILYKFMQQNLDQCAYSSGTAAC